MTGNACSNRVELSCIRSMCGIGGEIALARAPDFEAVRRIGDVLAPRGPDGSGEWRSPTVALTHRRLKVIDLSAAGDQPFVDRELGLVIVFNGCIYNHNELRVELKAAATRFTPVGHRGDRQGISSLA